MADSIETIYPYKAIPLTPSIIEELTIKKFAGKMIFRQVIVDEVVNYHEKNGGLKANTKDIKGPFKNALQRLKEKGIAQNPSPGYWKIGEINLTESYKDEEYKNIEVIENVEPIADKVIGLGKSCIYLYYLPMYRLRAEAEKELIWHCKIGKTDRDPLSRVLSQAATALPENPHIALIFKTDYPSEFEGAIHRILTIRGRKIDSSPGSEWFLTSPDEVEKIISSILK